MESEGLFEAEAMGREERSYPRVHVGTVHVCICASSWGKAGGSGYLEVMDSAKGLRTP